MATHLLGTLMVEGLSLGVCLGMRSIRYNIAPFLFIHRLAGVFAPLDTMTESEIGERVAMYDRFTWYHRTSCLLR